MKKLIAFLICMICVADIGFAVAATNSPTANVVTVKKVEERVTVETVDIVTIDVTKLEVIDNDTVYVYESADAELAFDATTADGKPAAAIDAVYDENNKHWLIVFMEFYTDNETVYLNVYKNK